MTINVIFSILVDEDMLKDSYGTDIIGENSIIRNVPRSLEISAPPPTPARPARRA